MRTYVRIYVRCVCVYVWCVFDVFVYMEAGLPRRFRVAGNAKRVEGGPTKHETHLTPIATLIILILFFIELDLFNKIKI